VNAAELADVAAMYVGAGCDHKSKATLPLKNHLQSQ
jgi:hypothetical protein